MLKLCPAKRPSASAAPAAKRLIYFGKRPSGTPPFEFVNAFFDWAAGPMTETAPCSIIMSKADGFQAQIIPGPSPVILTKVGMEYRKYPGRLRVLDGLIRRKFPKVVSATVTHKKWGIVTRFYAEVVSDTGDGDSL
jgi:hypothetical protein